jgi:RNA polymerase sigma-70 factor, ECF subfamily
MMEDWRLLKRMRRGDKDALRGIYEKYKEDLFRVGVSLLGDAASAEDCLQDVFVSFAAGNGAIRVTRNLKGYLIASIVNRARDQLRKRVRQPVPFNGPAEVADGSNDPVQRAQDGENHDRVLAALNELPCEQREVIILHVQGERTFRQIAELQQTSIGTALSRYRYGMDKLRSLLHVGGQS